MTKPEMPDIIYVVREKSLWIDARCIPLCPTGGAKYIRADLATMNDELLEALKEAHAKSPSSDDRQRYGEIIMRAEAAKGGG